jgi:transcriptional regulator with XRE-family HTH domain
MLVYRNKNAITCERNAIRRIGRSEAVKLEKLKEWREYRGLTQVELADLAGVPQSTVSQAETGRRSPHPGTARKFAEALGVEVEELTRAPKAPVPRSARLWLEEILGHNYLAWDDQEATKLQESLNFAEEVEGLRAELRDEYDVIREALDSRDLRPELRTELEAAKKTLLQWHLELTKIIEPMRREQSQGLPDEEP